MKFEEDIPDIEEEEVAGGKTVSSVLRETVILLLTAIVLAWFIYTFVLQTFWIPSGSMEPTIVPGDRVLVAKFYYRFFDPKPGDVIVFPSPKSLGENEPDLIKRIIARGGMEVVEKNGIMIIDGKKLKESYIRPDNSNADYGPFNVPDKKLFVMGDNRANSKDSRFLGPIEEDTVIGRAFFVYWPPNRIGRLE